MYLFADANLTVFQAYQWFASCGEPWCM
uniref:Uncharacterized protein n=1 Tax=Anguilla anguilla TaxID=7936 RepID=A0A0E9VSQ0_ANGAN